MLRRADVLSQMNKKLSVSAILEKGAVAAVRPTEDKWGKARMTDGSPARVWVPLSRSY